MDKKDSDTGGDETNLPAHTCSVCRRDPWAAALPAALIGTLSMMTGTFAGLVFAALLLPVVFLPLYTK